MISTQSLTIPNVISAEAAIVDFTDTDRDVRGVILITDADSNTAIVAFGG